nr:PH23-48 [Vibrio phage 1]
MLCRRLPLLGSPYLRRDRMRVVKRAGYPAQVSRLTRLARKNQSATYLL